MSKLAVVLLLFYLQLAPRQIVDEAQRRTTSQSQRYEGTLQVIDAKNKITEKRWIYDRIGSHGDSKAVLRFTAARRGERGRASDHQSSRSLFRPVDVDSRHQSRATNRASRSIDTIFRNGFQLRRSRGTRYESVRLQTARRRIHRWRFMLEVAIDTTRVQGFAIQLFLPVGPQR